MTRLGRRFKAFNFNPVDKITLGYILITLLYLIIFSGKLENEWFHILVRFVFIGIICWMAVITPKIKREFWLFVRGAYPLILFGFFYSETDYLNNILFNNLDPIIEKVELSIFGVHPSVVFSQQCPQVWFSELMNFGYFSYYFLILLLPLWLWGNRRDFFYYSVFIISTSFYIFYLFFIIFPVAGPQFYLDESLRTMPNSGIFRSLVIIAELMGEGPTAAFPSSHVGIVLIMAYLSFRYAKLIFPFYAVFGLLICFSTVYIKAHYAVDVFGGLLFAPLFFWISNRLWRLNFR